VVIRLLQRSAKKHVLAVARQGLVTYRNGSTRGAYVYLEVRPREVREASYTVRISARR
jgi:hypothetical protein